MKRSLERFFLGIIDWETMLAEIEREFLREVLEQAAKMVGSWPTE